jgi:hypothetical protein
MRRRDLLEMVLANTDYAQRFWARFWRRTIAEPMTGCLLWTGADNGGGYGVVTVLRRPLLAHRVSLSLSLGRPVVDDALHRCEQPACVLAAHLYEGDQRQNNTDMVRQGGHVARRPRVAESERWRQIAQAREAGATVGELRSRFNVSAPTVYRALARVSP